MKDGKVFTDQELEEMGMRTVDLALEAIDAGEKEKAKELCRRLYQEALDTHDSLIYTVTGFMSEIYRRYGNDVLEQVARAVYKVPTEKTAKALSKANFRERVIMVADELRGHFQPVTIEEDDEKVSLTMKPCGATERMLEQGAYDGQPCNFVTIEEPHAITWGKEQFPIYCIHAPVVDMLAIECTGYPVWVFSPAEKAGTASCSFCVYKDPQAIPEEVYQRVGKKKPSVE